MVPAYLQCQLCQGSIYTWSCLLVSLFLYSSLFMFPEDIPCRLHEYNCLSVDVWQGKISIWFFCYTFVMTLFLFIWILEPICQISPYPSKTTHTHTHHLNGKLQWMYLRTINVDLISNLFNAFNRIILTFCRQYTFLNNFIPTEFFSLLFQSIFLTEVTS